MRLPDHWLTLDSLSQVVGLTAEQRVRVADPYNALNGVLKQAADKRAALRGTMPRRVPPDEMTPEQRQAMRARMDSVRAEFEPLQAEADEWHATIRNLLTPEQQAKFDGLPKPRVLPERRMR
jgi:Spy/CpxP family protein refolding chaperone